MSRTILANVVFAGVRLLVVAAAGLGTSIILARGLGPEHFGHYRLVTGVIWGLEVLSILAFPNAVTKFVAEFAPAPDGRDGAIVRFFARQATVVYAAAALPMLLAAGPIAGFFRNASLAPLLAMGVLAVLPGLYAGLLAAALRGRQRFRELNSLTVWQTLAGFIGTAVLLGLGYRLMALFALLIGLNVFNVALAWAYTRRPLACRGELDGAARRRMARYGAALGLIALLGAVVWERSEVLFLGRFSPASEVGFYSLAYALALQTQRMLAAPFGEVLFPMFSQLEGLKDRWGVGNALVHATRYLAIVGCLLALGGVVFAEPVVELLFGPPYRPVAPVLAILMVSGGALALSHPAGAVLVNRERYRFLIPLFLALAGASVVLSLLLIPPYAALGAAVANTTVQCVGVAVQVAAAARLTGVPVPLRHIVRCLAAALVTMATAGLVRLQAPGGPAATLLVMGLIVLVVYPLCLRAFGAFVRDDVERVRAVTTRLPGGARWVVEWIVSADRVGPAPGRS